MTLGLPVLEFEWQTTSLANIAAQISAHLTVGRVLVLVDGASGSGKSTLAHRLADLIPGAGVVGTDDIAWHLHPINWSQEMLTGVVRPWLAGHEVHYRPPGWIAKGRSGEVTTSASTVLIVEGVGAGRRELAELASFLIYVNTDPVVARERCLVRDIGIDGDTREEVAQFHAWWQSHEVPFLLAEAPWNRADLVVDGEGLELSDGQGGVDIGQIRVAHPARR